MVCWYIASKSGDVPKETQSSLANNVRDVEQAGTMQDSIVRYEVVPSDMQMHRWHRTWNEFSLFQSACMRVQVSGPRSLDPHTSGPVVQN